MSLIYFVLLGVLAKNVECFNPNRHPTTTPENIYIDNFPEVEYPSSIMDTTKPFYLNVNPFSSDVQTSFKSLTSGGTNKQTPTIIVNVKSGDKPKDKNKQNLETEKTVTDKVIAGIEKNNKNTLTINLKHEPVSQEEEREFSRSEEDEEEESMDYQEMEFILGLVDNLEDFITTAADVDTEIIDITNSTVEIFDDERLNDTATITADVPSVNNFVAEFNQRALNTEMNHLDELSKNATNVIFLVNGDIKEFSDSDDTSADMAVLTDSIETELS